MRAADADVLRIAHPELKIWPDALLKRIDAALAKPRRPSWGAATPRHLASSFIRCGVCGASVVVSGSKKRNNLAYVCDRHRMQGTSACLGIGYRSEPAVDAALLRAIAPLVDGDIAKRSMKLLRERLGTEARSDGRQAARERIEREIAATEHKAKNLADAIARGGNLEPLLVAMRGQTERADVLRAELAQLDSSKATPIEPRRVMEKVQKRLGELSKLLRKGGVAARPVVAAIIGTERLVATPILGSGGRQWQLAGEISAGYRVTNVVKEAEEVGEGRRDGVAVTPVTPHSPAAGATGPQGPAATVATVPPRALPQGPRRTVRRSRECAGERVALAVTAEKRGVGACARSAGPLAKLA